MRRDGGRACARDGESHSCGAALPLSDRSARAGGVAAEGVRGEGVGGGGIGEEGDHHQRRWAVSVGGCVF